MKSHLLAISICLVPTLSPGQSLTDEERKALLEKIQNIQEQAESNVDKKYRNALSAFSSAMVSPDESLDLYLECEEMINFERKNKKGADFREWRKNNHEKLTDNNFKLALQFQLRWLVLSLQASSKNPDPEKLALEASSIVDNIVSNAEKLAPHKSTLNQSVLSTVFAQSYNITNIEIKDWPMAPAQFDAIYEQVILPPLRRPDRVTHLTTYWQKRINQQGELVIQWHSSAKPKSSTPSPEYEKFMTETLPQLRWDAEVDVFKIGDQRASAERMVNLIQANINHQSAQKWIETLTTLVK